MTTATTVTSERADLLASLQKQRGFLRYTLRDLTDEQAALRPAASELCLGGLVKHVAATERTWANFIREGASAFPPANAESFAIRQKEFAMLDGETVTGVLDDYERVARDTDDLIASLDDLDASHALPQAPWFEPGAEWSARLTILHIIAETAQHAGHADILRESIDGAKTMG